MDSASEIVKIAKKNKAILMKHFSGNKAWPERLLKKYQKHELNAMMFLAMEKPLEFCRFTKTTFFELEKIINNPEYTHHQIAKKKGGYRNIHAPSKELKSIQKRFNYFLQAYYLMIKPIEVHGFVVNPHYLGTYCNIVANAKVHVKKRYVLNIDLQDFFPSIQAYRVKRLFLSSLFEFNEQTATVLALLTTYQGSLPIGAPTSPVISNFICMDLDRDLKEISSQNNLAYTRYADDLTFSCDSGISNVLLDEIIKIIRNNKFEINERKLRLKLAHRRQTVTGITVNEKVNVDRKLLKKIRAMVHDLRLNGIESATRNHFNLSEGSDDRLKSKFINRLEGYINFVGQVRGKSDPFYLKQKSLFDGIFKTQIIEI